MSYSTLHETIGSILKDTVDWKGSLIDFYQPKIRGIGRYFRANEKEEYPILFDLDLPLDSVLGSDTQKIAAGLKYVLAEAVYNSIKAYRDSEKNTGFLRTGGIRISAHQTDREYRIEIEDRAGGIPENILRENVERDKTIIRSKQEKTGGGHGFKDMKRISTAFGWDFYITPVLENDNPVGTTISIVIPKSLQGPTDS